LCQTPSSFVGTFSALTVDAPAVAAAQINANETATNGNDVLLHLPIMSSPLEGAPTSGGLGQPLHLPPYARRRAIGGGESRFAGLGPVMRDDA
jgi:hypothetical protein